jgi:large subunit ribosomal protein L18e
MKKIKTTNPDLINLFFSLKKQSNQTNTKIWRNIGKQLAKPKRNRIKVNISRINRHSKNNDTIIVPGKVLGAGQINHPVTVAAFAFSEKAGKKIKAAKGKCLSFYELIKENPQGSNITIIG